jgi:hypothetical protein
MSKSIFNQAPSLLDPLFHLQKLTWPAGASPTRLNKSDDDGSPCHSPLKLLKNSLRSPLTYIATLDDTHHPFHPTCLRNIWLLRPSPAVALKASASTKCRLDGHCSVLEPQPVQHFAVAWWRCCILGGSGGFPHPNRQRAPPLGFLLLPHPVGPPPPPRCCSALRPPPASCILSLIPVTELLRVAAASRTLRLLLRTPRISRVDL